MVDVSNLPRPKKQRKDGEVGTTPAKSQDVKLPAATRAPKKGAGADKKPPIAPDTSNAHKPARGRSVPKQFMLPEEVLTEFTVAASERGYRRDNQFFLAVWDFWKKHNS